MNVSASILGMPLRYLFVWLHTLKQLGIKTIHYDVMDGHLVPNITFGLNPLLEIHALGFAADGHFMVDFHNKSFATWRPFFAKFAPYLRTFIVHWEAINSDPAFWQAFFQYCQDHKIKIGLAIQTTTPLTQIYRYLPFVHHLLVMAVPIGASGQMFQKSTLQRLQHLVKYRKQKQLSFVLEVDGGVNQHNFHLIVQTGCDSAVIGKYLQKDPETRLPLLFA